MRKGGEVEGDGEGKRKKRKGREDKQSFEKYNSGQLVVGNLELCNPS